MKKVKLIFSIISGAIILSLTSCKKCHECHYDAAGDVEVELGEYCDDDLEALEANGYHDHNADTTYEVHCHEH